MAQTQKRRDYQREYRRRYRAEHPDMELKHRIGTAIAFLRRNGYEVTEGGGEE